MRKIHKSVFLTLATVGLSVSYSSLFATENHLQQAANSPKQLLAQSQTIPYVYEYINKNKPASYNFLKKQLDASIQDAKQPNQNKVINNLWALSTTNPKIKTRERDGKTEFLMVSWLYTSNPSTDWPTGTKQISRQTWLTAFPQVQEFCQHCKGTGIDLPGNVMLALRLQQYLGLILNKSANKTHFVEMWVKAEDLSRPCIDPEINDSTCNVLPVPVPKSNSLLHDIYQNSFENEKKEYYPWTGLGYTYDWGNPNKPHVGASEFLINGTNDKPVTVEVVAVKETLEYCNNQYLK
ncbi:hypothetical protein H6G74_23440 [Nostoc spongiaeforme FACHB-130]|uniref:Uncharacterized protein n=1 Tax=Nostoc spongiaeforme FACHB-130 TaxID=1357510 RepID=A0ABR8G269_9NOSO|nr:hypothetical protein [Nostoc spongiaeforme]MBD2597254.1 hypothetical protein [Nostoc spongiaeforme FACHB-130]